MQTPVRGRETGITNKAHLVFQTPTQTRSRTDHSSSSTNILDTPKPSATVSKCENSIEMIDKIAVDVDTDDQIDSGAQKATISQPSKTATKNVEENCHTPISFNMNKFIMCFKSEPDLSRAQNSKYENVPMLNRGRFIAKKLLGGVSMVNLRRPFANTNEKVIATAITIKTQDETNNEKNQIGLVANLKEASGKSKVDTVQINIQPEIIDDAPNKNNVNDVDIDDDEDFVDDEEVDREYDESDDKENEFRNELLTRQQLNNEQKTIEYISKVKQCTTAISCNGALLDSIASDSVSPITKSTHRMSKAMQVSDAWQYPLRY